MPIISKAKTIDLADLSWGYNSSNNRFDGPRIADAAPVAPDVVAKAESKYYSIVSFGSLYNGADKSIAFDGLYIRLRDTDYTDVTSFKQYLRDNKVMLTYETVDTVEEGIISYKQNQLVPNGNFKENSSWRPYNSNYVTTSIDIVNGELVATIYNPALNPYNNGVGNYNLQSAIIGHKYYLSYIAYSNKKRTFGFDDYGGYYAKTAEENVWTKINTLWDNTKYKGNIILLRPGTPFTEGEQFKIKDVMSVDLTEIYGAGNEPTTVEEFLQQHPEYNNYVPYYDGPIQVEEVIL